MIRRRQRSSRAFTLIELLVVIVILGILMAVAVPTFLSQQTKAKDSKTQQQLNTAYKAIRSGLADFNNQYPATASIVSVISQSEPELTVSSGACTASTNDKQVVVDNVTSSAKRLSLYAKSSSGSWWNLVAPAAGAPVFTKLGTCAGPLATATVTANGNEITDATRAAAVQGDGGPASSSYGMWGPTTNLVPNGGFENNATGWGPTPNATVTRDNTHAKFGSWALKIVTNGVGNNEGSQTSGALQRAAVTAGTTYTASTWVYSPTGGEKVVINVDEADASTNYITSWPLTTVTLSPGWQRLTETGVAVANTAYLSVTVRTPITEAITVWQDATQVEAAPFASPYVDTNGATVARGTPHIQAPASLLSETQGWYAIRVQMGYSSAQNNNWEPVFGWIGGSGAGENQLPEITSAQTSGWEVDARRNGVLSSETISNSWNIGDERTLIVYWTNTTVGLSVSGSSFKTMARLGSVGGTALPATFDIGGYAPGGAALDGNVVWFACGTGTLTDSDAATINSFGDTDPTTQDFPAAAQATMAWSADNTTYVTGN